MKLRTSLRKGHLVATVLAGSWRREGFPPLDLSEGELDEITPLLCKSGVAALGWRRVRDSGLAETPSAEVLHQAYRLQSLQSTLHEQKIEKLFRVLRKGGIPAILAKGWAASLLYDENDLRPSGDIDLYVRPQDHKRVQNLLQSSEASDCFIDLHKQFSEISDRSFDTLIERRQLVSLGEEKIAILSPEDHLALLCIHLLKHGAWRPLWLCDISAAIEAPPPNFDWELCLGNDPQRSHWITSAIALAGRLLGTRVEQTPAASQSVPNWLVETVLYHWSRLFPGDSLPMRAAPLMAETLRNRQDIVKSIIDRWPDPITATFNLDGRFNRVPRLPYQIADFIRSGTRFMFALPSKLQTGTR